MDKKGQKDKSNAKKNLIKTRRQSSRQKIIITVSILLVVAIVYYLVDSGSYVASVNGHRISKAEYQFFLSQQQSSTEQENAIGEKSDAEKKAFWLNTVDGQNPWEKAKSSALDSSKDYMIQLIKAQERGLKVNSEIKSEVSSFMESTKSQLGITTDKQFATYVNSVFKITPNQFRDVSEKLMLIDKFKQAYLSDNYKPAEITDEDVRKYYDKDPKQFDTADIRYIYLSKLDDKGNKLPDDQISAKQKKAEEALSKIKQGGDIEKIIAEYTEQKATDSTSSQPLGSFTGFSYYKGSELAEWVFSKKPGDSGIIDLDEQFIVVKIDKRTAFDDVKSAVKTTMQENAKESFYDEALSGWRMEAKYNIIRNDRIYESFSYK
jgi:foldase protein PrsA